MSFYLEEVICSLKLDISMTKSFGEIWGIQIEAILLVFALCLFSLVLLLLLTLNDKPGHKFLQRVLGGKVVDMVFSLFFIADLGKKTRINKIVPLHNVSVSMIAFMCTQSHLNVYANNNKYFMY